MTQPELLGPPPKAAKLVKVSLFLKKRPDITDDYFRAYWYHNHRVLFVDTKAFRKYVRKYNQSHYVKDQVAINSEIINFAQPEYDGVAEFWLDSLEDWRKLWADPEFTEAVAGKSGARLGARELLKREWHADFLVYEYRG
ncbi:hypothetical protein ACRE_067360 [Hapsidospora chrysogenum ATCC 11550]|uniref:EthD domain-containing protein n=1 Tax=Hapsidospora chrysogenum (strain ATCC 11550 / CBS 779.69 / DSM 880 / IAM 14645 / JCM 23072 / IMI 49137) TaxID=857340 RepID=A0A086SZI2_HAPC1|nr:hypothetical protein ACRE_067360 [Hapsidospora chrysogenum ATCC 11550]